LFGLPIRIEVTQRRLARRLILSEFDFNTPLDESLFDTTAPAGYTVQQAQ
jgi:outer membrane lipoprotein-sorting protein